MSAAQASSWTAFLKSIASFNGDLSSLTAPPFILSPVSLVEYSQYWAEHPDLLVEPTRLMSDEGASNAEKELWALKRIIAVTKWFISTLRSQYCLRNEAMGSEKKPLNPFLGEVFVGQWEDKSADGSVGPTRLVSEQVSHHPPVTAYSIINEKNQVYLQGYNGIKSSFATASISVKQYGHAILEYKGINESYLITLPPLHIEGMITASPFVELEGMSYIQSSSGYIATIDYSGRGYFSGKKNTFKARIFKDLLSSMHKEKAEVTISGQWSGKSYIGKGSHTPSSKDGELFYDARTKNPETLLVKPIESQNELESRKAWFKVAEAIRKSAYDLIHEEKSKIENNQRELRKNEQESGSNWKTRWFDLVDYQSKDIQQDHFLSLTSLSNLSKHNCPSGSLRGSKYDTGSAEHWRYNENKWRLEEDIKI